MILQKNEKSINIVLYRDDVVREELEKIFGGKSPKNRLKKELERIKKLDGPVPAYMPVMTEKLKTTAYVIFKNNRFVKIEPVLEKVFYKGSELYRYLKSEFDFVKLVKLLEERDYVSLVYVNENLESSMVADVICLLNVARPETTTWDLTTCIHKVLQEKGLVSQNEYYDDIWEFLNNVIEFI